MTSKKQEFVSVEAELDWLTNKLTCSSTPYHPPLKAIELIHMKKTGPQKFKRLIRYMSLTDHWKKSLVTFRWTEEEKKKLCDFVEAEIKALEENQNGE